MLWILDPRDPSPLHEQVARCVRDAVRSGDLAPGHQLPASRELARELDVNMHTVLRAYQTLQEEGLVDLRRGRGASVTRGAPSLLDLDQPPAGARDVSDPTDLPARARALGLKARRAGLDAAALEDLLAEVRAAHEGRDGWRDRLDGAGAPPVGTARTEQVGAPRRSRP